MFICDPLKGGKGKKKIIMQRALFSLQNHNPKVSCSIRRMKEGGVGSLCSQHKDPLISVYAKRLKSTHSPSWQEGDYQPRLRCSSESVAMWSTQSIFIRGESAWGSMPTLCEVFSKVEAHQKRTNRNFPGGPVAKTPCSQRRGPGFNPWSGN